MTRIPALFGRGRRGLLLGLLCNGLGQAAVAITGSLLVKYAFDHLFSAGASLAGDMAWQVGCGLLATAGVAAWLRVNERVIAETLGQHYAMQVRMALYDHLSGIPTRALQGRSRGALVLRFVGDLSALRQWVSLGIGRIMVTGLVTVGVLATLLWMNWPLAAAVAVILGGGMVAVLPVGQDLRAGSRAARRQLGRLAANINERVVSMAVVQAYGQTRRERRRIEALGNRLRAAMIDKARAAGRLRATTEMTAALAHSAALLIGALQVSAGHASVGAVVAAMTVIAILLPQLRDLGRVQQYWHGAAISLHKIRDFLDLPAPLLEDAPDAPELAAGAGRLEFRGIAVAGALQGIDATAEAGSVVAIVGPNGAGKSTLLSVAARLLDPTHGEVLLDGQILAHCKLASVRRAIGIVGADLPLLRGTVERNLRYRMPKASAAEYARVKSLCGVDEVLRDLPDGARTRIGEGGTRLSAGQRQRIALARALLGAPVLLLLDEADANLDSQASGVIDRVLARHRGTALIVTHRRERVLHADVIWYLEAGTIVEAGPPARLLATDSRTARLFAPRRIAAA